MAEPSDLSIVASRPEDPGYFIEDFCNWQRIPEYREFVETSPAAAVAGQLMGCKTVRLYHDHLLVKEPKTVAKTPWHQDQPYYNIDGFDNVSMWLPVDPVAGGIDAQVRRRNPPPGLDDAAQLHDQ
jgi:ectoine hydroxylase-related dioxygenase (phytanoyl-CoA dioxygenase family)